MSADHRIVTNKRHGKPPIPRCSPIDLGTAMGWHSAVTAASDPILAIHEAAQQARKRTSPFQYRLASYMVAA
jgi:hypothetical protein